MTTTPTLFYEDGSHVPPEKAAQAKMGKSGTVGYIFSRGPCSRCGGAGGWEGWPGFTCYRCYGKHSQVFETYNTKVWTREGLVRLYTARERAEMKRAEKVRRETERQQVEFDAWAADHAELVTTLRTYEGRNEFLKDLRHRIIAVLPLTERQAKAATEALEREARKAAEAAAAQPLPDFDGRVELEMEILSVQYRDSPYGTQLKMLARHADGWKLWGTCPRTLEDQVCVGRDAPGVEALRGATVRFMAAVEPSRDDPTFGFFSRPTQAELVVEAEEVAA